MSGTESALLALGLFLAANDLPRQLAVATEMGKLDGTWVIVEEERDGKSIPRPNSKARWVFEKGQLKIMTSSDGYFFEGEYLIGTAQQTKSINFSSMGLSFNRNGETFVLLDSWFDIQGIYSLEKDTLRACYVAQSPGDWNSKTRPTEFRTREGGKTFAITFHLLPRN